MDELLKIDNKRKELWKVLKKRPDDVELLKELDELAYQERQLYQFKIAKYYTDHLIEVCTRADDDEAHDVYLDGEYCWSSYGVLEPDPHFMPGISSLYGSHKKIKDIYQNTKREKNGEMIQYRRIIMYHYHGYINIQEFKKLD